ncbi:acetyl-CoA carboxylase biotin carboxylase subunit family protein [Kitasatospora sp. NPDC059673]|uniref:ATP-grasp domain-containing protein n=1 Tax=Kitasatospora sp. NPDC059673 TaxID=3346901 RepID=UPI0036827560
MSSAPNPVSPDRRSPHELPLLAVVYDLGAVGPAEIVAAARGLCRVILLCDPARPHVAGILPELRRFADVLETGADPEQNARTLAELTPDGITTFSEYAIRTTADLAARLGLPYHDGPTASRLTDKYLQREALAAAAVDAVRCVAVRQRPEIDRALAEVGAPAVVKPRRGAGSRATHRVDTTAELADLLTVLTTDGEEEYVVEELLAGDPAAAGAEWGDYVSVESLVRDGEVRHVCVTGKFPLAEPFREVGQFLPGVLPAGLAERCTALTERALRALGVTVGVTHTELKLTDRGPRVIEVNGRIGGYVNDVLNRSAGYNLLAAALRTALGLPLPDGGPAFRQVAFRRYLVAPATARQVLSLDGAEAIGAIPGVQYVEWRATPGAPLDWRDGTQGCLGVVYGIARDHDALRRIGTEIDRLFTPVFAH